MRWWVIRDGRVIGWVIAPPMRGDGAASAEER